MFGFSGLLGRFDNVSRDEDDGIFAVVAVHVIHSFVGGTTGSVDAALAALNRQRHVALSMPHFFPIARAVADSRMIATFPERLAMRWAPVLGLRVYQAPVKLAPISLAVIWHRRNDGDAGHVWFRQQIMNAAQSLG